jgi:hypothetical protein
MELSRKQRGGNGWRSITGIAGIGGAALVACTACCLPPLGAVLAWLGMGATAFAGPWGAAAAAAGAVVLLLMVKRKRKKGAGPGCAGVACATGCATDVQPPQDGQILPPPVACTLSAADFKARAEWLKALKERALIGHRVEDNRAHLVYKLEAESDVALMVKQEQTCCSFLRFDLRRTPATLELTVTAPADAGIDAQLLFAHLIPS